MAHISQVVDPAHLNYLVVNHMEPDHSGALCLLRRVAPRAKIIAIPPAIPMLAQFYRLTEGIQAVSDGEKLDLGGKILAFYHTPFVYWPETMATYEATERVFFSCDAFGGFRTVEGAIFTYFSNIAGMQSQAVLRAIEKLRSLEVEVIAPSHGLIWRRNPEHLVELYARWARMEGEPGVTIVFGSMYRETRKAVEAVARGVREGGLPVGVLDASRVHPSFISRDAWRFRGLILGSPTYDTGIFPEVEYALSLLGRKRLKNRVAGLFGSHGWKGGAVGKLVEKVKELGWQLVGSVEFPGEPGPADLVRCAELGQAVAARVKD